MSHAEEVITDVSKRRVSARADDDCFTIAWDYPGRTLLEVRILRSRERVARAADEGSSAGQEIVYEGVTGSFQDTALRPDRAYFYTVFARHPGQEWVRWEEYSLPCAPKSGWREFGRLMKKGWRNRITPVMLLVLCMASVAACPSLAAADAGSGGEQTGSPAGDAQASVTTPEEAAAFARADRSVAAVLGGKAATVDTSAWGGGETGSAGYTCIFRWPASSAGAIEGVWPLLHSGDGRPAAPFDATTYRWRVSDVSSLRVDVLASSPRILQVMPLDGETDFELEEQTWAPFSWMPWFTERPWVLAPVFVAVAVILVVHAWRRSRAWNRRLPSMTRHDRQFINRVVILVFMLAGFVWQLYEAWFAASGPSVTAKGSAAGDLSSLPMLLIPPVLFIVGLVLELSAAPHRGAWALLAVISGAASVFYLATAITVTTTNLNLSYFVLLAVLALIGIPRAFAAGKMGWSRTFSSRYG